MRKRRNILLTLSVTIVSLLGSTLSVSAAPTYADLFDAEYYAETYSDVEAVYGNDEAALFNHYMTYGIYEGRVCNEAFNVQSYRESYDDLEAAFGDDWKSYVDHYLNFGLVEGRDTGGMFDAVSYANRYPDLKEAFGYDVTALWAHYEQFGIKEGRIATSQTVLNNRRESKKESKENSKEDKVTIVSSSLVLSGNAKDVYTTTKPEYIETDKFVLYLAENITLKGDTVALINEIMQMTETQTGLTLADMNGYGAIPVVYPQDVYGAGSFADADPQYEKFHIYVLPNGEYRDCEKAGAMFLSQWDLDIAGGNGANIIHQYTHALQYTNGISLNNVMNEGFAAYTTAQVINENPDFYFDFNANLNYSWYFREITSENAEAVYLEENADGWMSTLYGYRFMLFLAEEYGEQVYIDILNDATKDAGQSEYQFSPEKVASYIKANTSNSVFVEFGNWMEENKERFEAGMYEETPEETPDETPVETPDETPDETPEETPAEIQEPLVLSGNPEDTYTTTRAEYIETDKFVLYLDENITFKENLVETIETLLPMAEEQTGLSFAGNPEYEYPRNTFIPDDFYGPGIFEGIDPHHDKLHILVVADGKYTSCATSGIIVLNEFDINSDGFHILVHEYIHCLQQTNGISMDRVMDEGFATYHTGQVVKENPDFDFNFNADLNYSNYDREITAENAETIFMEEKADGWENYLYGYRFLTFLSEEYGEQVYLDILYEVTKDANEGEGGIDADKVIPYIKAHTSEDVFVEFANWLEENKERIESWKDI